MHLFVSHSEQERRSTAVRFHAEDEQVGFRASQSLRARCDLRQAIPTTSWAKYRQERVRADVLGCGGVLCMGSVVAVWGGCAAMCGSKGYYLQPTSVQPPVSSARPLHNSSERVVLQSEICPGDSCANKEEGYSVEQTRQTSIEREARTPRSR